MTFITKTTLLIAGLLIFWLVTILLQKLGLNGGSFYPDEEKIDPRDYPANSKFKVKEHD